MNASLHLLHRVLPATVHLQPEIAPGHPSAAILGAERLGTGVVVGEGAILTAHYVVVGARSVRIDWLDGAAAEGRVAAIDYESGLGLVTFDGPAPRALAACPAEEVRPGIECFVVASVGDGRQVATGIVTAVRPFEALWEYRLERGIHASAESPGLGGGPLIDARGRLLGVCALALGEVGRFTLAVPCSLAEPLLDPARSGPAAGCAPPRAWLGLTCYPLGESLVVAGVIPGSPAAVAGLRAGDVLATVDGAPVGSRADLFARIWRHASGEEVLLRVSRDDGPVEIRVRSDSIERFFAVAG